MIKIQTVFFRRCCNIVVPYATPSNVLLIVCPFAFKLRSVLSMVFLTGWNLIRHHYNFPLSKSTCKILACGGLEGEGYNIAFLLCPIPFHVIWNKIHILQGSEYFFVVHLC